MQQIGRGAYVGSVLQRFGYVQNLMAHTVGTCIIESQTVGGSPIGTVAGLSSRKDSARAVSLAVRGPFHQEDSSATPHRIRRVQLT